MLRIDGDGKVPICLFCLGLASLSGCGGGGGSDAASDAETIRVPQDFASIQAAINVAMAGDTVLVAPGIYAENIVIVTPGVRLHSQYVSTADAAQIQNTVLDGGGGTVVTVGATAAGTVIAGFTVQNGDDGISCAADTDITDNIITGNGDGIDFEGGGGVVARNRIHGNRDDGVDLDGISAPSIRDNIIVDNDDDGIEIRLHDYVGAELHIEISGNRLTGNREDGIQLIDYPGATSRSVRISRNIISDNAMAGIGFMANGNTVEDYSGAAIEERVVVANNTVSGNEYGITGGGNAIVINNIVVGHAMTGVRNATGGAVVAYTLFWDNGLDHENSTLDLATILLADPLLGIDGIPSDASPAIDAGTDAYTWNGEPVFSLAADEILGAAPDLGAVEVR